jgi:hypothetical protein
VNKHTPGPWAAFTDDGWPRHTNIVAVVPHTRCVLSLPGRHKDDPDVRLATAAPELLDALVKARAELAGLPRSLGYEFTHLREIDAAIAKATGA